jgi:uncharacterized caspase-like protein
MMIRRSLICLFSLILVCMLSCPSQAAEQRTALVIGNGSYSSGPLKNPVNDAADMAATLKRLGFNVNLKKNANLETMEEAIEDFGNRLKRGGVGLFYYAGHGVQVNGVNYLIPIGAKINKESDVRFKAFDAGRILAEMENANNGLNIVLLDACRDNPFSKSFRSASRGLAIVSNAPTGTFISYSTSPGQVARDGEGRNSPYTNSLLQYMQEPGVPIGNVFMKVRGKVKKETGQVPWELSSLEGDFYFMRGKGNVASVRNDSSASTYAATDALDEENSKLDAEQRRLEQEKVALAKQKALDEKRRQIEEERERLEAEKEAQRQAAVQRQRAKKGTTLAVVSPPSVSTGNEIKRDGRFIAYSNGTVLDTQANLMWAARDNGSDIDWANAKSYCENYRGGGYTDWRMPTWAELAGLYDISKSRTLTCSKDNKIYVATELIDITCWAPWANETRGSEVGNFGFNQGKNYLLPKSHSGVGLRALPVRSAR